MLIRTSTWILTCILLGSGFSAPPKPKVFDTNRCLEDLARYLDQERYDRALNLLVDSSNQLPPRLYREGRIRLFAYQKQFGPWQRFIDAIPEDLDRLGYRAGFHAFTKQPNRARGEFFDFFQRGGQPEALVSNSFLLGRKDFFVPGHWVLLFDYRSREIRVDEHAYTYLLPDASRISVSAMDNRDMPTDQGGIPGARRLFTPLQNASFQWSEMAFQLPPGPGLKSLFTAKPTAWADEAAVIIGMMGEHTNHLEKHILFCPVGGRGLEYRHRDFSDAGVIFDLHFFTGGTEETNTYQEMETWLASVMRRDKGR